MREVNLIKSLGTIFFFVMGIYILLVVTGGYITQRNKVAEPIPVFDTTKEPQSQQEYESMIVSKCVASQQEYKKQADDSLSQCNEDSTCIQKVNKQFATTGSDDFVSTCIQAIVMNDEMSTEIIKGYAQQTQLSVYVQQSKSLSDTKLMLELKQGLTNLNTGNYDINFGLQMSADVGEYYQRNFTDPTINDLIDSMLDKYGPCWGIPSGQCVE